MVVARAVVAGPAQDFPPVFFFSEIPAGTLSPKNRNTRFAWAGGTFFLVVLYVVSVFGSGGKKVLVQF
jgi:hypothetical protein